jgi:hypothetical protein
MVGGKSGRMKLVVLGTVVLAGCGSLAHLPPTPSELVKGSSYLPLTPKPIVLKDVAGVKSATFLNSLPNETMRISIGSRDEAGSLTFGSSAIGQEHHSYEVVVDYIKYTTGYLNVCFISNEQNDKGKFVAGVAKSTVLTRLGRITVQSDTRRDRSGQSVANESSFMVEQRVPVYVGVGFRIQASVQVLKGNVQLSLFGLGAAAGAGQVVGTMVIQTLGVFGAPISPLIPLPTDISQSSIQTAMQSLAAIKAKLYDPDVNIRPQVIGFETMFGSPAAVQLIEATIAGADVPATIEGGMLKIEWIGDNKQMCP